MAKGGIYKITNLTNHKVYLGSTKNFLLREWEHFHQLKKNTHINSYLQNTYNKYGKENFKFEIIEEVLLETELISREQYYLDTLQPFYWTNLGYNINPTAGSMLGFKHKEESKQKTRNKLLGHRPFNTVAWNKGLTKETDQRVAKYSGKSWCTGLTKETDSRVAKISTSCMGREAWNKGKTGLVSTKKGKRFAEVETRICRCGCSQTFIDLVSHSQEFLNREHYEAFRNRRF